MKSQSLSPLFNLIKGQLGLAHFYDGFSRHPRSTIDSRPYDCRLTIWYLPIGIIPRSACFAAYIPPLHRLPIHFVSEW